jgi:acetamidase/formamidase
MAKAVDTIRRLGRSNFQMYFDRDITPVLEVKDGERFVIETEDAHCGTIRDTSFLPESVEAVFEKFGGLNPVTGPIYIEGAEEGGCISVVIEDIQVAADGWGNAYSARTPEGALEGPAFYSLRPSMASKTTVYDIEGTNVFFPTKRGRLALPLEPMIGTIGVAPKYERRMSFAQGSDFMGNVDIPDLRAGVTVVLPVHHPGGLLSVGDCHAAQGDGEISAGGVEIQADITVQASAQSREEAGFIGLPQINSSEWLGSVAGFGGVGLADNVRAAYVDLARRLETYYDFDLLEAYELLGHAGRVRVGLMCDPEYSAMARIDRKYVE